MTKISQILLTMSVIVLLTACSSSEKKRKENLELQAKKEQVELELKRTKAETAETEQTLDSIKKEVKVPTYTTAIVQ